MQEQSQRPAFDEDQVCKDTVAPLNTLVKLIMESSPNAVIQVYESKKISFGVYRNIAVVNIYD